LLDLGGSSSHGSRSLAPPCRHALVHPLPFRRFRLPFGQTLPPVWTRSAFAVSHRLDGFLCTCVAGLLRPAASLRFNAFQPGRPGTRRSSGAFSLPASLLPFEGYSSSIAVSHRCDRFPRVVRLSLPSLRRRRDLGRSAAQVRSSLQVLRSCSTSQVRFPVPPCGSWLPGASALLVSQEFPSGLRSRRGYASRLRVVLAVHRLISPCVPARGSSVRVPFAPLHRVLAKGLLALSL
jgi:hypothetical protein